MRSSHIQHIKKLNSSSVTGTYDADTYQPLDFFNSVENFKTGSDSPRAFLERCLETISEKEAEIHAFAHINCDLARRAADASTKRYKAGRALSPLDGCPVAIKDTFETFDMPMQQGSSFFGNWKSNRDAACVWALRRDGATIVGKTHVPEYAMGKSPPTRNPFDLRRTPGGSSSGSGASVGAKMVPIAIGNQTMASLIRPASYNANYGFKPTLGALNTGGMHPIAPSQDHIGPMAGTLSDMWLAANRISSIAGGHNGHPGLSGEYKLPPAKKPTALIWIKPLGWDLLDEGSVEAFDDFLAQLREIGINIIHSQNPAVAKFEKLIQSSDEIGTDICFYEARWPYSSYIELHGREKVIGEAAFTRISHGMNMTREDYRKALLRREELRAEAAQVGALADGFITLASSGPAPIDREGTLENYRPDKPNAHLGTGSRSFVTPWTLIGGPALSMPWLSIDQMPLGIQLMGLKDTDEYLVSIARWIDKSMGK